MGDNFLILWYGGLPEGTWMLKFVMRKIVHQMLKLVFSVALNGPWILPGSKLYSRGIGFVTSIC